MNVINKGLEGQNHDRIPHQDAFAGATVITSQDDGGSALGDPSAGQKMLSAISGSLLTSLLVTPLDVVRVRLQSQGPSATPHPLPAGFQKLAWSESTSAPNAFRPSNLGVTACCREVFFMNNNAEVCLSDSLLGAATPGECAVQESQKKTFNSTLDGIRKIARNEGFTTLWRGLSPTLLMSVPGNIIYFTGYDWLRFNKASPVQKVANDQYASLIAGSSARVLAAAAVNPMELFKTRLQASTGASATNHLKNTLQDVREMVAENGYRSLWRGITITLWRDVPFSGMYWWGYETIRGKLTDMREERRGRSLSRDDAPRSRSRSRSQSQENHTATFADSFTAGALSGSFASIATMPFDVGKTRTQIYRDSARKGAATAGRL